MIYIPAVLEETVRQWIGNSRRVEESLDLVSQECLGQLLEQKREALGRPPQDSVRQKHRRKGRAR